jgi:hypothetical protein
VPEPGKTTGGGTLDVTCGVANFGFVAQRKKTGGRVQGHLTYVDQGAGIKVKSTGLTSLVVTGNTATFSGTCRNNGTPCTFTVEVVDNSEPGTGDEFTITLSTGYTEGGVIRSGNIQVFD